MLIMAWILDFNQHLNPSSDLDKIFCLVLIFIKESKVIHVDNFKKLKKYFDFIKKNMRSHHHLPHPSTGPVRGTIFNSIGSFFSYFPLDLEITFVFLFLAISDVEIIHHYLFFSLVRKLRI